MNNYIQIYKNAIDDEYCDELISKFEIAFGRIAALPDGEIAYAVMTYASKKIEGHIIRTMETPAQQEKCVLEVLFNYKVLETPTN